MAERLTEKNSIDNKRYMLNSEENTVCVTNARLNNCSTIAYCWGKPIDKLAQLEDIMDKYGIEDLEQYVEEKRKQDKELRDNIQQLHTIINSTGYDRDTWKRACELACEREDDCYVYDNIHRAYEFYQQAKKEGNDE